MPPYPETTKEDRLAEVFAALADPTRLRILGQIAERSMTGSDLSKSLGLTPPTISHHMTRLARAGLVTVIADGNRRHYRLNESTLASAGRAAARSPGRHERVESVNSDPDAAERARVLRDFFEGEGLKQIPAQRKKRVIVLQHLVERFEPGRDYPEKEVNAILRVAHDDVATLRRELVTYGYMTRANGVYRLAGALPSRGATVAQEISGGEHGWLEELVASATTRAINDNR